MGFKVRGWINDGVSTTPITSFVGGPQVMLKASNTALPPSIASQLRGFQPADGNLSIVKVLAGQKPALDGSLKGWENAVSAHFLDDGLNVDGPGVIDARLMYDVDTLYIHWTINLNQVRHLCCCLWLTLGGRTATDVARLPWCADRVEVSIGRFGARESDVCAWPCCVHVLPLHSGQPQRWPSAEERKPTRAEWGRPLCVRGFQRHNT